MFLIHNTSPDKVNHQQVALPAHFYTFHRYRRFSYCTHASVKTNEDATETHNNHREMAQNEKSKLDLDAYLLRAEIQPQEGGSRRGRHLLRASSVAEWNAESTSSTGVRDRLPHYFEVKALCDTAAAWYCLLSGFVAFVVFCRETVLCMKQLNMRCSLQWWVVR